PTALYLKLFDDPRGAAIHRELASLWSAARGSATLRMSEPPRDVAQRGVEGAGALPTGVAAGRVRRCLGAAANALRALQETPVLPEQRRTFADELANLRERHGR